MQKIVYYIVKQTALDGKQWFVVRGISPLTDKSFMDSQHKLRRDAEYRLNKLNK